MIVLILLFAVYIPGVILGLKLNMREECALIWPLVVVGLIFVAAYDMLDKSVKFLKGKP
ncbi:MAG: hypothetical protein IK103_08010 [Bacteroidales bacterium]|nr:hypothetical protein [Bacteroidales bacterium]